MNNLKLFLRTPKGQMSLALFLILVSSLLHYKSFQTISIISLSLLATVVSDFVFLRIRKINLFFPSATIVSGLIIGLLISPDIAFYVPIFAGVGAMFSKNFLKIKNVHIFNPAVFGLLVGSFFLSQTVSWWAVSFQQFSIYNFPFIIYFLILLCPAFISILRMQRQRIILSFIVTFYLSNVILNSSFLNLNSFFDPTLIFFSLVMLPEPKTTPNNHLRQIVFGFFIALISILISLPILQFKFSILNFVDPLIFSLLLGNLIFYKFK